MCTTCAIHVCAQYVNMISRISPDYCIIHTVAKGVVLFNTATFYGPLNEAGM